MSTRNEAGYRINVGKDGTFSLHDSFQEKLGQYSEYLETLFAVAMRYCGSDRALAEGLTTKALQAAWASEPKGHNGTTWTKSHLLSHLRAVYLDHQRNETTPSAG